MSTVTGFMATDDVKKDKEACVKGATGIPTRTLVSLVLSLANEGK